MSGIFIRTFVLLAVTAQIRTQYVDIFQSFSSFLQASTTRRSDVTKKNIDTPSYQDAIFFETNEFVKQRQDGGTIYPSTTVKPKRRKPKTTTTTEYSQYNYDTSTKRHDNARYNENNNGYNQNNNDNVNNSGNNQNNNGYNQNNNDNVNNSGNNQNNNGYNQNNNDNVNNSGNNQNNNGYNQNNNDNVNNSGNNQNNNGYNQNNNDNVNNSGNNQNNNVNNNFYNYAVIRPTEKPVSTFNVAQKPISSRPISNTYTTQNPLLNRPGVRPAVVDTNRPPITNRPATRPNDRPVTSPRPDDYEPGVGLGPDEDEMSEAEKRRYYEMAEQKCDEYKAMNTRKLVALPLASVHHSPGVELNVTTCAPANVPLVIGGQPASVNEFPHMGLVGWKNMLKSGYSWKCGGSLISEQFVLTAGHCTYHDKDYNVMSGPPRAVQLGSSYIDGQDALVVTVSNVIRHPKYKLRRAYYDVALIKLTTSVTFSKTISPACLGVSPPVGNRIVATGWGRTEFGGDTSFVLRRVSVPVWDMASCRDVWGTSLKLPLGPSPSSQLCAGERGGGRDTCQGDSGGPAQILDGCTWRVVAVTSLGRSCGAAETPALYATIPRAFIASQVFANVKLTDNQHNDADNGNNNAGNGNNNGGSGYNNGGNSNNNGNNWSVGNGYNNQNTNGQGTWNSNQYSQSSDVVNRPGNHQVIGNNNYNIANNNNGEDVNRPGNHQAINYSRDTTAGANFFITRQTSSRYTESRLGNHQILSITNINDNAKNGNNYFVTSQSSGNNKQDVRLGNHQTVTNSNRGNAGRYFVTSHTSSNREASRLGNHQTVDSNTDNDAGYKYFVTSYTSGSKEEPRLGNHQRLNDNSNMYSESLHSESNIDGAYQ